MNLQKVAELKDLYPLLVTRSKVRIVTNEVLYALSKDGQSLAVTVKTLFPPSARRRTELRVQTHGAEIYVEALERTGMADAQRFAQLLRERVATETPDQPMAPLVLSKDEAGDKVFIITQAAASEPATVPATPAAKTATPASKPTTDKGAL